MRLPGASLAACLFSLLFAAAPAIAGDDPYAGDDEDPYAIEDAGSLFKDGVARMTALDWETACSKLDRSYALDPRPGTLYTLAECETQRGHLATGAAHFKRFITIVNAATSLKQRQYQARKEKAEKRRAEIEPLIPMLALTLAPDAPWTTVVRLDGAVIELNTLGAARGVDPGPHIITVDVPGGKSAELKVTLKSSDKEQIMLPATLPPKPCTGPVSPAAQVAPAPLRGGCTLCAGSDALDGRVGVLAAICALAAFARRRRER